MKEQNRMILIPSGKYNVGTTNKQRIEIGQKFGCHPTWLNDDLQSKEVDLKSFWLDRHPVTNAQYLAFVEATGYRKPNWWNGEFSKEFANHPVVGVSGIDAEAYAKWSGKRLPSSEEWESAISHQDGKIFPWGDEWKELKPKSDYPSWASPETSPIGTGKQGLAVSGIEDFVGQASEWTSNVLPHHGVQFRMIRGSSWFHRDPISYRSAFGWYAYEGWSLPFTGFRCALDGDLIPPTVPERIPETHKNPVIADISDTGIRIQSGSGNSSYISILVPYFGSDWIGLSSPEGVSWNGEGLLNWYDKRDLKWEESTPTYAKYVMMIKDIKIIAEFIVGDDYVDQIFNVEYNKLKSIFRSSSCFNLRTHPLFYDFEGLHTYTLTNKDDFVLIRNFERPSNCVRWIVGSVGPELTNLKRAMLAVTSQDGKYVIGCARADKDGHFSVACNMCFTCLHPDSSYPVDKSRSSRLRMYFLKGGLDDLLSRFDDDVNSGVFD